MGTRRFVFLTLLVLAVPLLYAQTVSTSCALYPGAVYCTSIGSDNSAATVARQQQYETGQAIGNSVGMAIFRAHFPGWRRKYCSAHPTLPFYYGNAAGDSITGTCPTLQGLSNEAAAEFVAKHPGAVASPDQAVAVDKYIAENHLPPWQPTSYERAIKAASVPVGTNPQQPTQSVYQNPTQDVFVWFDEPFPVAGTLLTEVLVTSHAYDGAVALLRRARQGNTSVKAGMSVLDTDYHPATASLASFHKNSPDPALTLFYWQGEKVEDTTPVMHFRMTKRAYEQMLALMAGTDLRAQLPQR